MNQTIYSLIILLILLLQLNCIVYANDVIGCGGFVVSSVSINYEPIKIQLFTDNGIIKYISDCAPNNGYYFIPLYDIGKYVLRIHPPRGWTFDPSSVEFNFDGKNDLCSQQVDINFVFKGFTIFGKIFSLNSLNGSKGVKVKLLSNNNIIKQTVTVENGLYEFNEVFPGQYIIEAYHERWKFIKNKLSVNVVGDNIDHQQAKDYSNQLCILGYSASGKVVSDGRPIKNVQFILFSQNEPSFSVSSLECNQNKLSFLSKLELSTNLHYLCHTSSNEKGEYYFNSLPNGKYIIYSYYETQNIRFEVKPKMIEFDIAQDDVDFGVRFEIGGFSIFGQVINSLNPDDLIKNAHIKLIDENSKYDDIEIFVKDSTRKFTINNIKTSNYLIKTSAERYQFDNIKYLISPNSPNIPVISPSRYEICGKIVFKNFEYKFENIELLVFMKETKTLKESFIMENDQFCFFLPGGDYQLQLNTKYSNLKFIPNLLDLKVNKPNVDIVFEQMTVMLNGNIKLQSPLIDNEPDFLTVIFSNNEKMPLKSLQLNELTKKSDIEYRFTLDNLLPGEYFVSLGGRQANYFCWHENSFPININEKKIADILFKQKGVLLQITLSHVSELLIKSPSGLKSRITQDSISDDRLVRFCTEEVGKYTIEPIGCHKFFPDNNVNTIFDTKTMAGQMISLTALKHLVTSKILSTVNITDLKVKIHVISNEGENEMIIPITNGKKISSKSYEYELQFYGNSMSNIHIEPKSSELIFKPSSFRFQMNDDCYKNVMTFQGKPGIFINGEINQKISEVKITIYDNETNEILHETITNNDGKYKAGPFEDEINLKIVASKEDYVFKPIPNRKGYFEVSKLSSITTMIVDENGKSLTEVLVSISGGLNNYRRNSVVNAEGKLLFDNLHSGQYFIRFLRKEYDFEPASKMIDIQDGDNIVIKVVGKKVAFSCIGLVDSLNGEPEPGVIVEAVGIRKIIENSSSQCTQLQEQSISEMNGSFRILGLLPDCQYVIRIKTDSVKNKNITKSLPQAHSVRVQNKDLTDIRFIVIYKTFQMDLTASVQIEEEYLNTITIKLFLENESRAFYVQTLSSPFVFLPSIPLDNRTYEFLLDSNLDTKLFQYSPIRLAFRANESYAHYDFNFNVKKRLTVNGLNEEEIASNWIYSLFLFLFGISIYNYKNMYEFVQRTPFNFKKLLSILSLANDNGKDSDHNSDSSNNNANKQKKAKIKKN